MIFHSVIISTTSFKHYRVLTCSLLDLVKMDSEMTFTKKMRHATREIHSISDALVNAKLAVAMSNNSVWAEGLLVFYEIFNFLEIAMGTHAQETLGQIHVPGMERTSAFEDDLKFYLGDDWKTKYCIRESVANYLKHLIKLEKDEPTLLIAYVYHLYMGLLSGGQILAKKRNVLRKFLPFRKEESRGCAVTTFEGEKIFKLKRQLVENMNNIASGLDEATQNKLIEESKKVFVLNNEIIRSVQGTNSVLFQKMLFATLVVLSLYIVYVFSWR